MEENRRPRKNGPYRKRHKDAATQTSDNQARTASIQERCGLCQNRVLSVSSPNDIPVEDDLPDNICQCFFSNNAEVPGAANFNDVPEVHFAGEQNGGQEVPISDSPDNLHPVEPRTEESNSISKNDESSGEESKLPECSPSSNGYASSLSEQAFDVFLHYRRRRTPLSSGKSSKNSPKTENSPNSNGHASPLHEQSHDQNVSDQRNNRSPISGRGSKNSSDTEKGVSSGYPFSLMGEQSGENFSDRTKSTSLSSGEDSKNFNMENGEASLQSLNENNLEQLNISECKFNVNFSSNRGEKNDRTQRGEYDYQRPLNVNKHSNVQYENIPTELAKFRSENPRPVFPPPFSPSYQHYYPQPTAPPYQPQRNPAINMSMPKLSLPHPQCHMQSIQSCGSSAVNMPINRTDIPGRLPVSRPQMHTTYYRGPDNGNANLSQLLFPDNAEDPEKSHKKENRIKNWLENLPSAPPIEEASGYASGWSAAENEENEGIPPDPSAIFFDDRSSTEISEEENRIQRSLRRPPRKNRK